MSHKQILKIIEEIRVSVPNAVQLFTNGKCLDFFFILNAIIPNAVAYYDGNHVITKIGDRYYDIIGEVKKLNHLPMIVHYPNQLKYRDLNYE